MKFLIASLLLACGGAHAIGQIQTNQDDGIVLPTIVGSPDVLCGNTATGLTYTHGILPLSDPLYDYKLLALMLMKSDPDLPVTMKFKLPSPALPTTYFGGPGSEKCLIETMVIHFIRRSI